MISVIGDVVDFADFFCFSLVFIAVHPIAEQAMLGGDETFDVRPVLGPSHSATDMADDSGFDDLGSIHD